MGGSAEMNSHSPTPTRSFRRKLLFIGGLLLLWPLLRFLVHKVPRKPRLIEVSGSLQNDTFLTRQEFIIFQEDELLWAISRKCTHLGCRINYIEEEQLLECPCHQSRFSRQGEVIRGPADKPLTRFPVEPTDTPSSYLVTMS